MDERVPIPFSHHSHSGQFCGHAVNTLEEVVQSAIRKGMTTFCMTEHMPRQAVDFYPEESDIHSEESLAKLYDDFYVEARRLQKAYASKIQLFVGFEGEWIRDSSLSLIQALMDKHQVDVFVGSVHHMHTKPIDFDTTMYHEARQIAGGTDEQIYEDYFDSQLDMLKALKPPVVAHFDLIRLKSNEPDRSFKTWPAVWEKIERNLRFISDYDGVVELNSSSLRKGMSEAYPQVEICKDFLSMGGRFTVSDDSHGVDQVGLNYGKVMECIEKAGIRELFYLAPAAANDSGAHDTRFPTCRWQSILVTELKEQHENPS
ncbi:histidinol phosphate phosphatase H [Polychaeton citri CBS 116435]|uniref:Histidinol-phosphatase n=1 Tax=Polychaeton citri CBS 116435 TaxID=1314669 RepID=A0A9P4QII3_9PEZI|nr:histidinol phosphate phosphatase H [Polychaeton citri CBS 116435]